MFGGNHLCSHVRKKIKKNRIKKIKNKKIKNENFNLW